GSQCLMGCTMFSENLYVDAVSAGTAARSRDVEQAERFEPLQRPPNGAAVPIGFSGDRLDRRPCLSLFGVEGAPDGDGDGVVRCRQRMEGQAHEPSFLGGGVAWLAGFGERHDDIVDVKTIVVVVTIVVVAGLDDNLAISVCSAYMQVHLLVLLWLVL